MEDYITMEKFEKLKQQQEIKKKSSVNAIKTDFASVMGKFFHGIWIVIKLILFGLGKLFRGIYNGLIKLNEGMEKVRQSEFGKNLKKQQESQPKPTFNLQPPQQSQGFGFFQQQQPNKSKPKTKAKMVTY